MNRRLGRSAFVADYDAYLRAGRGLGHDLQIFEELMGSGVQF